MLNRASGSLSLILRVINDAILFTESRFSGIRSSSLTLIPNCCWIKLIISSTPVESIIPFHQESSFVNSTAPEFIRKFSIYKVVYGLVQVGIVR